MNDEVVGAVLAGGRGRRVGGDKQSLVIAGQTLAHRAVDALHALGLEIAFVLRPGQPEPSAAQGSSILRDEIDGAGPVGGLQALLRWLPVEWVLVVPCDQPFLERELLRGLLAQPKGDVDVVVGQPADLLEPLPGLYRRTCLPAVERALAHGNRSMRDLLASLRVRAVSEASLRRWDPQLLSYVNVNTPADLARARSLAPTHRTGALLGRRR